MSTTRDYYDVLGVAREATPEEIKSAYRKAALKHHPDRNPGDRKAEESFKDAAEAYAILSDPEKRGRYDRFGHQGVSGAGATTGFDEAVFGDFADILGDLFGFGDPFGRGRRRGPRRGTDLGYDLEMSLEEAAFGKEAEVHLTRTLACEECGGSGAKAPTDIVTCPSCHGSGQLAFQQGFLTIARTCSTCRGSGRSIRKPCPACRGAGQVRRDSKLTIKIPPGVDDGNRLRVRGEGESGEPGAPAGDLYVIIHVRDHEFFKRDGRNLRCRIPITFSQAALGVEIKVPLLGGGTADLKVPGGTQSESEFRIRGQGIKDGSGVGDLKVRAVVRTPARLSKEGKKALQKLAETGDESLSEEDRSLFSKVKDLFS
jgi:molecular chaperone DnaJ